MIRIKISGGDKWHCLHRARTLCGIPGPETDRQEVGLATHEEKICRSCDRELRRLGRATRRARDLRAAALRNAVIYRPIHREHFEMSVAHVGKASLVTIDPEDRRVHGHRERFGYADKSHTQKRRSEWTSVR